MQVTVLGATGRTGRLIVEELVRRGHQVRAVVRDPSRASLPEGAEALAGDARDPAVLARAVTGADAVVSALGPRGRDHELHRAVAPALAAAMRDAGVTRYVGISGAGVDAPGDRKRPRDRVISGLMRRLGGGMVADKTQELEVWRSSGLRWTLVRPPRLVEGQGGAELEHDAHVSTRSTRIERPDLARFAVDTLEEDRYIGLAPFVAAR